MKKSFIELYYEWMETGIIPGASGLCNALKMEGYSYYYIYNHFAANAEDQVALDIFWSESRNSDFNETRQNILLLLAARKRQL